MSSPSHPSWFNHPNNIRRRIQVMNLIIMSKTSIQCNYFEILVKRIKYCFVSFIHSFLT
jgi:hypothetical protein